MADDAYLRQSQIVTGFGPGALVDLPHRSVIVAALSDWEGYRKHPITEKRLTDKLRRMFDDKPVRLYAPPPADDANETRRDYLAARVFPTWFETQEPVAGDNGQHRRRLVRWDATEQGRTFTDGQELNRKDAKKTLVPVRFVCGCKRGHIDDIDWRGFIHRGVRTCGRPLWIEERGTAGDVADVVVGCDCGQQRRLYEAQDTAALGPCQGRRPWIGVGDFAKEACTQQNKLLVRTGSNTYFPVRMTVISLPDGGEELRGAVRRAWSWLERAKSFEGFVSLREMFAAELAGLADYGDEAVWEAIETERRGAGPDAELSVKAAEFDVLAAGGTVLGSRGADGLFYAETLQPAPWGRGAPGPAGIAGIVAVHRLREVTAQVGFTRIAPTPTATDGELDLQIERAALDLDVDWLPAFENRGEGVFIHFDPEAVKRWRERDAVKARTERLEAGFRAWKEDRGEAKPVFPGATFVMVHTFAHLLLTAISEECGYPASSLRERVYALEPDAFGVLLYTSTPGADGTLGGLAASAWRMGPLIARALELARLCSNDPICAHHRPDDRNEDRFLHGAACHGCVFIAETSCEQGNGFLDRGLVVETIEAGGAGFFGGEP